MTDSNACSVRSEAGGYTRSKAAWIAPWSASSWDSSKKPHGSCNCPIGMLMIWSHFTADGWGNPFLMPTVTSVAKPWTVLVTGATVTVDIRPTITGDLCEQLPT